MKRWIRSAVAVTGVMFVTSLAQAQSSGKVIDPVRPAAPQSKSEIGLPILKHEVGSGKEFADILRKGCPAKDSNASCDEILMMFQEGLPVYEIQNLPQLIAHLETWEMRPCVPGKQATMYRILRDTKTGNTRPINDWRRPCVKVPLGQRPEQWLVNSETGELIVSLRCGNVISSADVGSIEVKRVDLGPKKVESPAPVREKFRTSVTVFDSAIVTISNRSVTVRRDTILVYPDSSEISVRVSRSARIVPIVAIRDTIRVGGSKKKILAGAILGGVAGFFGGYYTGQQHVTCQVPTRGGPVNPPNNLIPAGLSVHW
jgi:hypothetical protein